MKQVKICGGYRILPVVILSMTLALGGFPAAARSFQQPVPEVIKEEQAVGHRAFLLEGVDRPPGCAPRPGYGPGERILFPPPCGFCDVWTLFYLNQDDEFYFALPMSEGMWASGDWFGLRHELWDHGVNIIGSYLSDLQGNVTGGRSQGFAYADCYDLRVDLDMQILVGWEGAHIVLSCLDRNGKNLSLTNIGNFFTVAEVWGSQTIQYYALWLDQNLFDNWWNIKIGRVATMDNFGSSPIYSLYVSGGLNTIPQIFPVSGFLSAYPATTWGGRLRFNDKPHDLYAMFGIYQTTDRLYKPAYHGGDFSIRRNDGINFIWEIGWTPEFQPHCATEGVSKNLYPIIPTQEWRGMRGNYKFGIFYTPWRNIPQFYPHKNTFYSYGFYWLFDQMIYQAVPGTDRGLTLWTAFIYAPQQNTSLLTFQGVFGAFYTGLIPRRSQDHVILALIYGNFSKDYASLHRAHHRGYPTYEMVLEASYRINLSRFFFIQPDLQYIIRPGGTGYISNALVLGVQFGVIF